MAYQQHPDLTIPSDTTYCSFNDIELVEPPEPMAESDRLVQDSTQPFHKRQGYSYGGSRFEIPTKMQRQDSGYESCEPASPRTSMSKGSRSGGSSSRLLMEATRRNSSSSARASGVRSPRPSPRRFARSYNTYSTGSALHAPQRVRSYAQTSQLGGGYVQFPTPADLIELTEPPPSSLCSSSSTSEAVTPLPQTTHYWTSNSTRRLEYAAIDAASRGVKGWVRKHLVPDCLVPQDSRHVAFDDDTGSVRRYRLQMDEEHDNDDENNDRTRKGFRLKQTGRRKSWRFWRD